MATQRLNLTNASVERLRATDKPYRIYDSRVRELYVRVQPSGVKSWNMPVGRSGMALGKFPTVTVEMARTQARANLGHVAKGEVPPMLSARRSRIQGRLEGRPETFDALLTYYEAGPHKKLRDPADAVKRIRRVYRELLALPIEKVTEERVAKIHAARSHTGTSEGTIARDFTTLHGAFTWAVNPKRHYVAAHPFRDLKPDSRAGRKIVRYLHPDERARLFQALADRDREMRAARARTIAGGRAQHAELEPIPQEGFPDCLEPLVRLGLNTACRRGELLALRWESIDLEAGHFIVEKARVKGSNKANIARPVILNRDARDTLVRWKKQTGGQGKVFPQLSVKKTWATLLKRAKIERFRFHDLRHDAASQLVMRGTDIYTVSKLLGHASVSTTERYAHLSADHLRTALGQLDAMNSPTAPAEDRSSNVVELNTRKHGPR
jgi:integrase